jgi:hypothetical protein
LVEYLMELRDDYDYKISKVSQMRKGSTLRDFVALIYHTDNVWHTDLIYEHRIWSFPLTGVVSKAFADKNGIATGFRGITTYHRPWTDPKELGI